MKFKSIVVTLVLSSLYFNPYAHSQSYDKAAQEKAALEKEAIIKQEQAAQQQNKQAQPFYYNKPEAVQTPNNSVQNSAQYNKTTSSGQFISCPTQSVTARITSSLPGDWWETPQQGNLVNTQVIQMSGGQTLQCFYSPVFGTSVPIMKHAPAGLNCVAQGNGFQCN